MNRAWLIVGVFLCVPLSGYGEDTLEKFALATQRETVLAELVPGTEDYYDFHARHYQNQRDLDALAEVLKAWHAKYTSYSKRRDAIEFREAILTSDAEEMARVMHLKNEHSRPLAAGEKSEYPSVLDPVMVSTEAFLGEIKDQKDKYPFKEFSGSEALRWFVQEKADELSEEERRDLLKQVRRPDFPELVPHILKALAWKDSKGFGEFDIHRNLLLSQLAELRRAKPELLNSEKFVKEWVKRLRPDDLPKVIADAAARDAYLKSLWAFVKDTPDVMVSLQAHVLFHQLKTQRELGALDATTLDAYLKLPRREQKPRPKYYVSLSKRYLEVTGLPSIEGEEAFVRTCLLDLYAAKEDIKALSKLSAEAQEALRNRVELEFSPENLTDFAPGDDVKLSVEVKNVAELSVRVFELNTLNYCRTTGKNITATIDLDGLRPGLERVEKFEESPIRRVRRTLEFPSLKGKRGAWIIEMTGNGVSSRALVKMGALSYILRTSAAGHIFQIRDESGAPAKNAVIYLGSRKFAPEGNVAGEIVVPFSAEQTMADFILTDGQIASVEQFKHQNERPILSCAVHVDAQSLIAGKKATVAVRPRFHITEAPAALNLLKDPVLVIKATLADGTSTTERVRDFSLSHLGPTLHTFTVPTQLQWLVFSIEAEYEMLTTGRKRSLESNTVSCGVNRIEHNSQIVQTFWTRGEDGWRIEVRGRNGEPIANHELAIQFVHRYFTDPIELTMASDETGMILIGEPEGIVRLQVEGSGAMDDPFGSGVIPARPGNLGNPFDDPFVEEPVEPAVEDAMDDDPFGLGDGTAPASGYSLLPHSASGSTPLNHGRVWKVGQSIVIPWNGARDGGGQLIKMSGDSPVVDLSGKMSEKEGFLQIDGLGAGHYRLDFMRTGDQWLKVVEDAVPYLQIPPLVISKLAQSDDGKKIVLQLHGNDAETRVHVAARRYGSDYLLAENFRQLGSDFRFLPGGHEEGENSFYSGRVLGDEYRYILERRSQKKYPGNMLPRPGLLVNPWSKTGTEQDSESLARGKGAAFFGSRGGRRRDDSSSSRSRDSTFGGFESEASHDFLGQEAVLLCNLKPDAEGRLEITVEDLKGNYLVEVFAENSHSWVSQELTLPETKLTRRDLRLLDKGLLDPAKRVAQRNTALLAKKDEVLELGDVLQAEFEVYDSLAKVFAFYGTLLQGDEDFTKFDFITRWPSYSEERKRELYSEFACHELNLFLKHKDPAFFEEVIRPWITNKYAPSFMDEYLLARDLSAYADPWRYDELNAVERALLGHAGEVTRMESYLDANPVNKADVDFLFSQALTAGALLDELEIGLFPDGAEMGSVDPDNAGRAYNTSKLQETIIPIIDFNEATLKEAIDFLRQKSIEHDPLETDPTRRGVNFIIKDSTGGPSDDDPPSRPITLRLSNVPLVEAIKYVTELAGLRYKVETWAIVIVPQWDAGGDMFTRTFRVPPTFLTRNSYPAAIGEDPFAPAEVDRRNRPRTAKDILESVGVTFGEGASAFYDPRTSSLIVRNTESNMELVDAYVESLPSSRPGSNRSFGAPVPNDDPFASVDDAFAPSDDPFASAGGGSGLMRRSAGREVAMRRNVRPFFQKLGQTRELAETHYYRVPMAQLDARLVKVNSFWLDAAKAKGQPFLSGHFMGAANSRTEALLALALLDLPFGAEEHSTSSKDGALTIKAGSPAIVLHRDFEDAAQEESPLLVGRMFFKSDEQFEWIDGKQRTKALTDGFLSSVSYTCSVKISNAGESIEAFDLLTQIPEGALPLSGSKRTDSVTLEIEPFGTSEKHIFFYFPKAGTFRCYPAQLSLDGKVLASTAAFTFDVKAVREGFDKKTWADVAAFGSEEDVLTFLKTGNLHRLELSMILWRLSEKAFFEKVIGVLTERQIFDRDVFNYGFKHAHKESMRQVLLRDPNFLMDTGGVFECDLLTVNPQELRFWELLEYDPFVNARAWHDSESPKKRVLNPALDTQLSTFFSYLSHQSAKVIDDEAKLAIVYYLLLQDRYEEGLVWFRRIDPDNVTTKLQFDYLRCWLAFLEEKPGEAEGIAKKYAAYPVDRWREKFEEVLAQATEIRDAEVVRDVKKDDREQELNRLAAQEVAFDMKVEKGKLKVLGANLKSVTFRYYEMDLEFLFSANPFVESDTERFSFIAPNKTFTMGVKGGAKSLDVDLPEEYQNRSVLVEAEAGGKRVARAVYANRMDIAVSDGYGRMQIREAGSDKVLPKVYVKVYLRAKGGAAAFYKDGYTDLRGKFDYASRSGGDIEMEAGGEFAIFVSSETHGAEIRKVPVPKR